MPFAQPRGLFLVGILLLLITACELKSVRKSLLQFSIGSPISLYQGLQIFIFGSFISLLQGLLSVLLPPYSSPFVLLESRFIISRHFPLPINCTKSAPMKPHLLRLFCWFLLENCPRHFPFPSSVQRRPHSNIQLYHILQGCFSSINK